MLAYEQPEARAAALSLIPVDRLEREADALVARATERASSASDGAPVDTRDGTVDEPISARKSTTISRADAKLLRLLRWFKTEFFTWCDAPACPRCGALSPEPTGAGSPTPDELKHGAHRVETYRCRACPESNIRFPRFNDAVKLLETRTGRCGEWANCFTLCCVAMGYDSRWVLDWTDHVWTEVYSERQKRWLHCDSCEDACDQPNLYEKGWGKKLSFVVAFGVFDVVDVTRRYARGPLEELTKRRGESLSGGEDDETWVRDQIKSRKDALRLAVGEGVSAVLERRDAEERSELGSARGEANALGEKLRGRTTGSLAWRAARGELGDLGSMASTPAAADDGPETVSAAERVPETTSRLPTAPIDRVAEAVRAEFARLTTVEKMSPNEAAANALRTVRRGLREKKE